MASYVFMLRSNAYENFFCYFLDKYVGYEMCFVMLFNAHEMHRFVPREDCEIEIVRAFDIWLIFFQFPLQFVFWLEVYTKK